jgi:hypothetical protein
MPAVEAVASGSWTTAAGRNPYDQGLTNFVGELSTRSEEFRARWSAHNVRLHRTGFKDIHHPVVGALHLAFEAMDLPADPGAINRGVQRRARVCIRGCAEPSCQLGGNARSD